MITCWRKSTRLEPSLPLDLLGSDGHAWPGGKDEFVVPPADENRDANPSRSQMRVTGALKVTMPTERRIVLTRIFDAARDLVFDAHTRPNLIQRWMLGRGGSLPVCEIDLRVGGTLRWVWRGSDGIETRMSGIHYDVLPPQRIVHSEILDGNWSGTEALVTTVFTERGGKTTLSVVRDYPSEEARDAALESGMQEDAAASYDRLAELLSSVEDQAAWKYDPGSLVAMNSG